VNAAAAIDLNVARGSASGASVIVLARYFIPPSFAILPLAQSEGAKRRKALGACEAPFAGQLRRPADADRRVLRPAQTAYAVRAPGTPAFRRFTAAIFWLRLALAIPLGFAHERCPQGLALVRSHVPLVVAEGRCRRTPPGGRGYEPARRTPHPAPCFGSSPEDALGERDKRNIGIDL